MKIIALHGLWVRSGCWKEFKEYFSKDTFLTPDIDWARLDYRKLGNQLASFKPDILLAHSFGGYVAQKLLEENHSGVKCCVLLSPLGPKGLSVSSFFRVIATFPWELIKGSITGTISVDNYQLAKKAMLGGLPEEVSKKYYQILIPEQTRNVLKALPFQGNVHKPISIPTLVVSGGLDVFLSKRDVDRIAKFHKAKHLHFSNLSHVILIKSIAFEVEQWIKSVIN